MFFSVVHDKNNRVSDFNGDCGYCVSILAGSRYTLTNRYTREFVEMEAVRKINGKEDKK